VTAATSGRSPSSRPSARPSTDDDELAGSLYAGLARALRWLRRTGPTDIAHGGLSAMATLSTTGPQRSGHLAEAEGVAPSTMSRILDGLVADGFVERLADPADRRALLVGLTPTGSVAVTSARRVRADALRARLAQLPEDEVEALRAALPALAHLVGG